MLYETYRNGRFNLLHKKVAVPKFDDSSSLWCGGGGVKILNANLIEQLSISTGTQLIGSFNKLTRIDSFLWLINRFGGGGCKTRAFAVHAPGK